MTQIRPHTGSLTTTIFALVTTARPHQWVKNLFVVAPLVFAKQLTLLSSVLGSILAFLAFSLGASAIYFMNDIRDIEKDRCHPVKRKRPIPAGTLSLGTAQTASVVLALLALSSTLFTGWCAGGVLLLYMAMNWLYSIKLKHIAYLDVFIIAIGFVLRVAFGAYAIGVTPSLWIVVDTLGLALFLGLGKRYHELVVYGPRAVEQRPSLANYRIRGVKIALLALTLLVPTSFLLYTFSEDAHVQGFQQMWVTTPAIFLALLRFYRLAGDASKKKSPTELIIRDPLFVLITSLWGIAVIWLVLQAR